MKEEQIESLIEAIGSISHGPKFGPEGLEMLSIALSGDGPWNHGTNVSGSLRDIAHALSPLSNIAEAVNNLADAIRERGGK